MASGYLRIATVGSTRIRMHWVAPVVWVLGGFSGKADDAISGVLAGVIVYGVHAFGHWLMANFYRVPVSHIDLDGFGASIGYSGRATRGVHAAVSFGGVLAHGAFAILLMVLAASGSTMVRQMMWVNFLLGAVNLLPFGRLDGARGWRHLSAVLRQPMPAPRTEREHPTRRARRLLVEADREIGHSAVSRPDVRTDAENDALPELDWNGNDPAVRDIARQFESLMTEVRADVSERKHLPSGGDEE